MTRRRDADHRCLERHVDGTASAAGRRGATTCDSVSVDATTIDLEDQLICRGLDELEDIVAGLGNHVRRLDEDHVVAGPQTASFRWTARVDALDPRWSAPGQREAPWHLEYTKEETS